MMPRATMRLQLHPGFTLMDAARHVPYYASLGVSHLYLSPVTMARKDSSHGYDVIDHCRIDPQLGGEDAFTALAQCAQEHGLGLILDIVPNHMAAHPDNPWWFSVLKLGSESPFARWFDIQWESTQPGLYGKVLLPVLSDMYEVVLERGDIRLVHNGASFMIEVHGQPLPLAPGSFDDDDNTDVDARLALYDPSTRQGRRRLHAVLQRQHYRLAWWQCAADQINWRRFFEISELAGVRVECDAVFDAVHELPLRLYEQGLIDGLRIDHVDGLAYPLNYCQRLSKELHARMLRRPATQRDHEPWLIVEKILAQGELLDERWHVHGTTGYDFMDAVSAVLHDPAGEAALDQYWAGIARNVRPVEDWRRAARALMLNRHFSAERDVLLNTLCDVAQMSPLTRDASRHSLGRALDQLLIAFSVYRVYGSLKGWTEKDTHYLTHAYDEARRYLTQRRDPTAVRALDYVVHWLKGNAAPERVVALNTHADPSGRRALQAEAIRRFQQLTPPLAAKALEDTVFYRYGRLLSRNDVGSDPSVFSVSPADFHDWNRERATTYPFTMNATATHDHKRGEDVRARLAVISELPDVWQEVSTRCLAALGQHRTIDCGTQGAQCYMLLQTIVGAWPLDLRPDDEPSMTAFIQRLQQWQLKALREAKQLTSWFWPDEVCEQEQADRIEYVLCDPESETCRTIVDFVHRIAPAGALNSLCAVVLRCMLPGVPDVYQGTELWDFSLVDPDNRRPVDMARREALLSVHDKNTTAASDLLPHWQDGAVKQAVLTQCLRLRAQQPRLFAGVNYEPLVVHGGLATHVLAFMRHDAGRRVIVVVSRLGYRATCRSEQPLELPLIPPGVWRDTRIILPAECRQDIWHDVLSGQEHDMDEALQVGAVLANLPAAVLVSS